MAHWTQDLEELCEKIMEEISEANKKLEKSGGMLTAGDVETLDKLTHTLKSIKTTLAMAEYDDSNDSYARGRSNRSNRGGSNRGGSYEGGSYARGRNARRDSRGRYSREGGYSRDEAVDEIAEVIRDGMEDMPEELKKDAQRFLNKLESM